jgi:nucleotide-binding universal stress UspA family protein
MKDILCPTDFTDAAARAQRYAMAIADRSGASITLLHVLDKHHLQSEALAKASALMGTAADRLLKEVKVNEVFREGEPLKQIIAEAGKGHALMVVGTHGPRGLRQSLLGADILKLVRHVTVPSLVVQADSPDEARLDRIVLPVAGHADIHQLLDAVCWLARMHGSEVHVFQVMRPGEEPSEQLLRNKVVMLDRLEKEGVKRVEANVPSTVFSLGFAEQTIRYAHEQGAGCIAIMAKASDDYRYIADAEKERLLVNAHHIPVLCAV